MSDPQRPDPPPSPPCDAALEALLMSLRRAKLAEVRAIEEYLGIAPARPQRERGEGKGRVWQNEDGEAYKIA